MSMSTEEDAAQTYRANRLLKLCKILQRKLNDPTQMLHVRDQLVKKAERMQLRYRDENYDHERMTDLCNFVNSFHNINQICGKLIARKDDDNTPIMKYDARSHICNWKIDFIEEFLTLFENQIENRNRTAIEEIQSQLANIIAHLNLQSTVSENTLEYVCSIDGKLN